jgi:hypothetical protein
VLNAYDTNPGPGFVSVLPILQPQIIPGADSLTSGGVVPNEDMCVSAVSFGTDSDGDPARQHTTLTPGPDPTGPGTADPSIPAQTSAPTDLTLALV